MNSTIEEDLVLVDGPEGSGGWEVNEDLWVNVTGNENGIYLSGNVIRYSSNIKSIEKNFQTNKINNIF